jgi:phosphate-selective porin OprO/OprP
MEQGYRRWLWGSWLGLLLLAGNLTAQTLGQEAPITRPREALGSMWRTLQAVWDDGLHLQTPGKEVDLGVITRLQADVYGFLPNDAMQEAFGDAKADIFFRRALLGVSGPITRFLDFKIEANFADNKIRLADAFIRRSRIPYLGRLTFGKFKVPFGLEALTSSLFTTFQEPALTGAFVPGREIGFKIEHTFFKARMTWALALTSPAEDDTSLDATGDLGDAHFAVRLTGLPWYKAAGKRLLHLGLAYSFRRPFEQDIRFRTRPEAFLGDTRFVDTGDLEANNVHQFGFESALVYGPWSLQSELMLAYLISSDAAVDGTVLLGAYIMASYFLTGEQRPYSRMAATFGRPMLARDILHGGPGAWEVAARVSLINLDGAFKSAHLGGGREVNLSLGLNWYPHAHLKVTWNYVLALVDRRIVTRESTGNVVDVLDLDAAAASIFMMRLQLDL